MCIDRQGMAAELLPPNTQVSKTYLPPGHPFYAGEARDYPYDPQAASALLDAAGWRDTDGDPATPRTAVGVPNTPPDTPLQFTYLTVAGGERIAVAERMKASLAECGIQMDIQVQAAEVLFAPGPDGPIFGRDFEVAQFGWTTSPAPPCFLYTSTEIPGPYPDHLRGWGGANASGFRNPDFDSACARARFALPDSPEYRDAHLQAQMIFAEDLPAIPLYLRSQVSAMRVDMCGVSADPSTSSTLGNLESFDYGEACGP
jgi:peptide/nickel transport system substrate-binding protein